MNREFTGITNHNEYFTNHYFAASFFDDPAVTGLIEKWRKDAREESGKSPWALFRKTSQQYYVLHEKYEKGHLKWQDLEMIRQLADLYLKALGYPAAEPQTITLEDGSIIPLYLEMKNGAGAPHLWVFLAAADDKDTDVLSASSFDARKIEEDHEEIAAKDILTTMTNDDLANTIFFGDLIERPRFILFISMRRLVLLDRNKWGEKKYFSFDLSEIFSRHEEATMQTLDVLLHRDALCPAEEKPVLDTLDANSYKNANAVSDDLKYALRESIELLGNEVLYYMRNSENKEIREKAEHVDAADLSIQCVRYMYRLLFLFFIESRPELGYAPVQNLSYLSAYSLESLREITERIHPGDMGVGDGYYINDTLNQLFDMIYEGYPKKEEDLKKYSDTKSQHDCFVIHPLKAHIFDRERTRLIRDARLRDSVMARIISLMSLTKEGKGKSRGRISYANLGINQLGSVYEALLSYRGFIAKELLYEVKAKDAKFNELDVGYFATAGELDQYEEDERVRYASGPKKGKLRTYEKGSFVYRLAGREREKSASYYTPEVLTQCLVKYALKELLKDKTADEILHLTVCEPAMGSAAFLNEAINQLSEAYLKKKQEETGKQISYKNRARELQKVKMYIADRNVYGIDLNPTAVELAEVSLWLNTIFEGGYVPWFRSQLVNGNSLIGARRQCYTVRQLQAKKKADLWYNFAPERVPFGTPRKPKTQIYHFLTGDPGMSNYADSVIKKLEPENIKRIKDWNKGFTASYDADDLNSLLKLSLTIDDLFQKQVRLRKKIDELTLDHLTIWEQKEEKSDIHTSIRQKDKIYDDYYKSKHMENAGPYARLKFAMDYWCALWLWPIEKADLLPNRKEFIQDLFLILEGTMKTSGGFQLVGGMWQDSLFANNENDILRRKLDSIRYKDQKQVDIDQLCDLFPRLNLVRKIASEQHFMHWELEFADVFADRGGFDLILGNPPWIKLGWEEKDVLADKNPLFVIKKMSASTLSGSRNKAFENKSIKDTYIREYISISGEQNFLNAYPNYPILAGMKANLYKCFIPQAWQYTKCSGVTGFVHPDGVFDDPNGGILREQIYHKLVARYQFTNELKLFQDVDHHNKFSLTVYGGSRKPSFEMICNLFSPSTIDECYSGNHLDSKKLGIKDANGNWNIRGSSERVIKINQKELELFSSVLDGSRNWQFARLPVLHLKNFLNVLRSFSNHSERINAFKDSLYESQMINETVSQKDGLIVRHTHFPKRIDEMIYSGPHIGIANSFAKTARRKCVLNSDYDSIDLSSIDNSYIPRCNYLWNPDKKTSFNVNQTTPWNSKYIDEFKLVSRKMLNLQGERSLISSIIPPQTAHIHAIYGIAAQNMNYLISMLGMFISLPYDFLVKLIGMSNLGTSTILRFPFLVDDEVNARVLLLVSLNQYYKDLWKTCYRTGFNKFSWSQKNTRLSNKYFSQISSEWNDNSALKQSYARRQALLEIDVLIAQKLGMTLNQLIEVYQVQFPVLKSYEDNTWYDQTGRIVYTINQSLTGVGLSSKEWKELNGDYNHNVKKTYIDDTQPGGPIERTIEYVAPFDRCDRIKDYETAWKFFEDKYGKVK